MGEKITRVRAIDVRFPTSRTLAGSDAMNPAPDYSAAYVILETDRPGLEGHGLSFTIGRGNDLVVKATEALEPFVIGMPVEELREDLGGFWRRITGDSQLRWLGPEKGVIHLATAAVVNAVWDLVAKAERKPLWKLLVDMRPDELVSVIPFRYIDDAITPAEALEILLRNRAGRADREREMRDRGFPAYTTSAGWIGYTEDQIASLAAEGIEQGFQHFKLKVGGDPADDLRRARLLRKAIGPDRKLMLDANQVWGVEEAIERTNEFRELDPWWMEEPTSPDDVLGHRRIREATAPIGVATGEHVQNRVMFKQLLAAEAIDFCQLDSARLGGVNEVLAVMLMAAKFGIPVCPHAGGVGLCEYVQHLVVFDYIAVGASLENRVCEFVDHLHEHFVDPVKVVDGHYLAPTASGYSAQLKADSLAAHTYPGGAAWKVFAGR